MVDTGATITLLIKKWVNDHGLVIKEKLAEYISGKNGTSIRIVGTTSRTFLLVPTLGLDVFNVAICVRYNLVHLWFFAYNF